MTVDKDVFILMVQPFLDKQSWSITSQSIQQISLPLQLTKADNKWCPHSAQDHSVYLLNSSGHTVLDVCVCVYRQITLQVISLRLLVSLSLLSTPPHFLLLIPLWTPLCFFSFTPHQLLLSSYSISPHHGWFQLIQIKQEIEVAVKITENSLFVLFELYLYILYLFVSRLSVVSVEWWIEWYILTQGF